MSQLFLGVRLECAKCHHHPFEKWSQEDFYSFAAFFGRLGHKGIGLSPPISGGEEMVYTKSSGEVRHPITQKVLPPRPLFGELSSGADVANYPRAALADWMRKGCKRKQGAKVPKKPWREYPPKLAKSRALPTTEKERRAWMAFTLYLLSNLTARSLMRAFKPSGRGRPPSFEAKAITAVAKQMGVSKRTARDWLRRFFPNGYG